jgi:hypothetical protein
MSVTFWCPQARPVRVFLDEDDAQYLAECSSRPELQLSNAHAAALLRLLGIGECSGLLIPPEYPELRRHLVALLNSPSLRARALVAPSSSTHPGQYTLVEGELDDARLVRELTGLLELVAAAHARGDEIAWG